MRTSKSRTFILFIVLIVMLLIAACSQSAAESDEDNSEAVAAGLKIYETGGASQLPCMTCHTLDGSQLVGPTFQGLGERAGSRISGLSAEEYIRQSITQPQSYLVPEFENLMPANYPELLSEEDIENLIAFLLSQ